MARRFPGGASTNRIVTDFNSYPADSLYSYSVWVVKEGTDDFRRIFDKEQVIQLWTANDIPGSGDFVQFQHQWSTEGGKWRFESSIVEDGAWHHLGVTYDGNSTANDPAMYADGVSQTVIFDPAADSAPSGSILESGTEGIWIGNRSSDLARCYQGNIAHLAVWHGVILTANEVAALAGGVSPLTIRPNKLVSYIPIYGTSPEPDLAPDPAGGATVTGTTVPADSAPVGRAVLRASYPVLLAVAATGELSGSISAVASLVAGSLQATHTFSADLDSVASISAELNTLSSTALYATATQTVDGVVDELDTTIDLHLSVDDDPASPDDNDWVNNAVEVS